MISNSFRIPGSEIDSGKHLQTIEETEEQIPEFGTTGLFEIDDIFHQLVEDVIQYLERLRLAWSEEKAELALECLFLTLSDVDSRLSYHKREDFKRLLVQEEFAINTMIQVMKRQYSSAQFYRRALGCLSYFIGGDSQDIAAQFVKIRGLQYTVEVMQAFDDNEIIQWHGFDIFKKVVALSDNFSDVVVEKVVSSIIGAMLAMHDVAIHDDDRNRSAYRTACGVLAALLKKKPQMREVLAENVGKAAQALLGTFHETLEPDVKRRVLSHNGGRIAVFQDIVDIAISK